MGNDGLDRLHPTTQSSLVEELLTGLRRLDARLEWAIQIAMAENGVGDEEATYANPYSNVEQAELLLAHKPGEPLYSGFDQAAAPEELPAAAEGSRMTWLQKTYQLTDFDLDLMLLALAPELDRRYEHLFAYLQNQTGQSWPTVDLALHLLCDDALERLDRRRHFDPDAALFRQGLLHLLPDSRSYSSLLAHTLKMDEQVIRFLMFQDTPDARIAPFCYLATAEHSSEPSELGGGSVRSLAAMVQDARKSGRRLSLYFQGVKGAGKRAMAVKVSGMVDAKILCVDLDRLLSLASNYSEALSLCFRFARLYDALLYVAEIDELAGAELRHLRRQLHDMLAQSDRVVILAGSQPWVPEYDDAGGVLTVPFDVPAFGRRRQMWETTLSRVHYSLDSTELDTLASRFQFHPDQIAAAVTLAQNSAGFCGSGNTNGNGKVAPRFDDLLHAARAQCGHELAKLARKIEPVHTWSDLVLPDDALSQLRELCQWVVHRHQVLESWGFDGKLSVGKGISVLFAGPSGAGKTMAAQVIANQLSLDLYKVDLAGVVSKYIGETEKNLDRIFTAAETAHAILFFDEADALFGKRSEVSDSHDRYANIEVSYLLQKMEEYEGVTILATNLRQNLDEAFIRRMAFMIFFPFPDADSRRRIWAGIWPADTPLADDMDFDLLARYFKLSGGNIKNVALAAAYLSAADNSIVTMQHIRRAARREFQKIGKPFDDSFWTEQ